MGLSIKDKRRARKKLLSCSPLSTGSLDPLSGVYASSGAGRYEERGGGVTDPGEYLIRRGFGIFTSLASSKGRGVLAVLLSGSAGLGLLWATGKASPLEPSSTSDVSEGGVDRADGEFGAATAALAVAIPAPRCLVDGFANFRNNSSRSDSTICHFIPLPGSSVRRGIFLKALLRDRLCRIEF